MNSIENYKSGLAAKLLKLEQVRTNIDPTNPLVAIVLNAANEVILQVKQELKSIERIH